MSDKIIISVEIEFRDGKGFINITYPKSQDKIPLKDSAHLLAGGIGVLIKACTYNDLGVKDYELVEEVVEHITTEFASTKAFEDAKIHDNYFETDE